MLPMKFSSILKLRNRYLLVSLLLHLVLLLLIWPKAAREEKRPLDIIEVDLRPAVSSHVGPSLVGQGRSNSNLSKAAVHRMIKQRDLIKKALSYDFSAEGSSKSSKLSHRQREGSWQEPGYTDEDDAHVAWGAGSGTFERIQDLTIMKRFHEKVDAILFYPGVLARNKISGIVNTRIVLDAEGQCDWKLTKINAADPHLRVYVLHLLKNVCDENFKKYLGGRIRTNIDMSFQFSISEKPTTDELIQQNQKVIGNVLLFFRNSHQSIAEWHLGPFRGVFPLPMVSLDFDWLQENFDRYINHRDPLKESLKEFP